MDWVKVKSKKALNEILSNKNSPDKICFVEASQIIKPKLIPNKYTLFLYGRILVPGPIELNKFYDNSVSFEDYAKDIEKYYNKANRLIYINELVYYAAQYDVDVILYCADDEEEFGYLDIFGDMMERLYGIDMISSKKYMKGRHSEHLKDNRRIFKYASKVREDLFKRYDAMKVRLPVHMYRRFTKKDLKEMPKKVRKLIEADLKAYGIDYEEDD